MLANHVLVSQHRAMRADNPDQPLIVLFDIEGTLLDVRHMVLHVLRTFDRAHGTAIFLGLMIEDIDMQEDRIDALLDSWRLQPALREHVVEWYLQHRWGLEAVRAAYGPYQGVLEVIRCLQQQPETYVGINSSRPERLRRETLSMLNTIGGKEGVHFDDRLLQLKPSDGNWGSISAKLDGVKRFLRMGYRVMAVVDSDASHLWAMRVMTDCPGCLFLRSDRLLESLWDHRVLVDEPRRAAAVF
jgi:hypothetical protein